jgi:hypothetical protein
VQAREIVTGSREGGFFIMIGHKPDSEATSAGKCGVAGAAQRGEVDESAELIHT